jgi:hypothetical protein
MRMRDVDIDLKNAQLDLLEQGKEVTVQSLSEVVGGIYGDDLIAGWLRANAGPGEEGKDTPVVL